MNNENIIVLRLPEVKQKTGLSRSSIYAKSNPKSKLYDETFPKPIKLGVNTSGWIEQEINDWIYQRIQLSRQPQTTQKEPS